MTDEQKLKAFEWLRHRLVGGYDAFPISEMSNALNMGHAYEIWDRWVLKQSGQL